MERLLLVEDHPDVLQAVRRALSAHFHVDVASTAEEAAALLDQHSYDAVLSDFELPDRNGLWVLQRAKERCPLARRVLTSAHPKETFEGADVVETFVRKPATPEQLLAAVQR